MVFDGLTQWPEQNISDGDWHRGMGDAGVPYHVVSLFFLRGCMTSSIRAWDRWCCIFAVLYSWRSMSQKRPNFPELDITYPTFPVFELSEAGKKRLPMVRNKLSTDQLAFASWLTHVGLSKSKGRRPYYT